MANVSERESLPLTFELKDELLAKLEVLQRRHGVATKSEIVRYAISNFDYSSFRPDTSGRRQMSVRLPPDQKATLLKVSRQKEVSIGELLRVALESLPANPAGLGTRTKTAIVEPMKKAAKKKASKKVAKKKVAKRPAKKAAKKKAAKKRPAAKKAAKKAAARPAKKKAAKKAKKK